MGGTMIVTLGWTRWRCQGNNMAVPMATTNIFYNATLPVETTNRFIEEAVSPILVLSSRTRLVAVAEQVIVYAEVAVVHVWRRTREPIHALFGGRTL